MEPLATLVGARPHWTQTEDARNGPVAVAEGRTLVETVLGGRRGERGRVRRRMSLMTGEPIVVGLGIEGKEDGSMWRSRLGIKLQK